MDLIVLTTWGGPRAFEPVVSKSRADHQEFGCLLEMKRPSSPCNPFAGTATESRSARDNRLFWNPSSEFDPLVEPRVFYPKPPMLTMKEYNDEARRKGKFLIGHGNTALSTTSPRWEDDPDGHGGTLHVYAARSVLIPDNALWAKWKSDCSSFPMHILKFIATNKGPASDLLRLISPEVRYLPGENLITEKIDQTGAFILITPEGQSDLALSVEGRMVIGFPEDDDYILESVSLDKSTQYVKDFAVNHLKNELYPCTPPGTGRTIGSVVDYKPALKEGKLFSNKVAKKFGSSNAVIWRAEIAQGEPIIINIGSGFRTADGLGVVLEMGQNGVILKWRKLWDQKHFETKYQCVI